MTMSAAGKPASDSLRDSVLGLVPHEFRPADPRWLIWPGRHGMLLASRDFVRLAGFGGGG